MTTITVEQAAQLIQQSGGRIFGCVVRKRSDQTIRHMLARLGVTGHLKGGGLKFDPAEKRLVIVFDVERMAYRSIALEGLQSLTLDGTTYSVTQEGGVS